MNNIPLFRAFFVGGSSEEVGAAKLAAVLAFLDDVVRFLPPYYNIR